MSTSTGNFAGHTDSQQIANYIGKLLRDTFGKGPESVYVSMGNTFFTVYLRNFMSPMEKALMESDQADAVFDMRFKLMQSLFPDIRAYVKIVTGIQLRELYCDWGLHNFSGMLMGISPDIFLNSETFTDDFEGRELIEQEIVKLSQQTEKIPEEIYSCMLNPKTIVIIRNGILVRIEKEFVRLGHTSLLRRVKANLEKIYLHNNDRFEGCLNTRILDTFVDWNFELDKSIIVMALNQKPLPAKGDRTLVDFPN